jgi:ActR/RegA family two-component response regulator
MANQTLLLVDDDPNILLTLGTVLSRAGFRVTAVGSPSDAIRHIAQQRFDIVVTDLNIGEPGDGFTVVSALRRVQPGAAALLITGFPAFEAALQAIRNQVDDFLVKPVSAETVLSALERIRTKPTQHFPLPLRKVSEIVRERREAIIEEWKAKLQTCAREFGYSELSGRALVDHLPAVIDELCARVESKTQEISEAARKAAIEHGRLRKRQNVNAIFLLNESTAVREAVLATIHQNMLSLDLSSLFVDLAVMSDSLDDQLKISMEAWAQ